MSDLTIYIVNQALHERWWLEGDSSKKEIDIPHNIQKIITIICRHWNSEKSCMNNSQPEEPSCFL